MESKGLKNVLSKLILVQSELKAPKNQYNKFGKFAYRSCEDILEAVKPICLKHNCLIALTDTIKTIGTKNYVEATAMFFDIDSEEIFSVTASAGEADNKSGMDASQVTGSASSYARKYALNGLLNIDDAKDADSMDNTKTQSIPVETQSKQVQKSASKPENTQSKSITEPQRKRLFALGTTEIIREVLNEYKIEHTKDIPMSKYDEICKKVEARKGETIG